MTRLEGEHVIGAPWQVPPVATSVPFAYALARVRWKVQANMDAVKTRVKIEMLDDD